MVELALLLPMLLLLLAGAVSFGHAYYMAIEVNSAAQAAATYGLQNPTDTAGMVTAAQLDAPDIPSLTAIASWGCECSDGTAASARCATKPLCLVGAVSYVDVTTTASESALLGFHLPAATFSFAGHSHLRLLP